MNETCPEARDCIVSYMIGYDSLKAAGIEERNLGVEKTMDVRLRMDGLFEHKKHAIHFIEEFIALYTNGPAGGGGISSGHNEELILQKELVERERVLWTTDIEQTKTLCPQNLLPVREQDELHIAAKSSHVERMMSALPATAAPSGKWLPLYEVAHSRSGDKGNDLNFSIIPHFPGDIERLKLVITPAWVKDAVSCLLDTSSFPSPEAIEKRNNRLKQLQVEIYEVRGIHALNVVVRGILDGGVNCSRRIDRHGKTTSDLILCQQVVLPQ